VNLTVAPDKQTRHSPHPDFGGPSNSIEKNNVKISARVANKGHFAAFGVRLTVRDVQRLPTSRGGDNRVLPAWISDGYFVLLPEEEKEVLITFSTTQVERSGPRQTAVGVVGANAKTASGGVDYASAPSGLQWGEGGAVGVKASSSSPCDRFGGSSSFARTISPRYVVEVDGWNVSPIEVPLRLRLFAG